MHKNRIYEVLVGALLLHNGALSMSQQHYKAYAAKRTSKCSKCAIVTSILAAVFGIPMIIAVKTMPLCKTPQSVCTPATTNMIGKCWSLVDGSSGCAHFGPVQCPPQSPISASDLVDPYNRDKVSGYCAAIMSCPSEMCFSPVPKGNHT